MSKKKTDNLLQKKEDVNPSSGVIRLGYFKTLKLKIVCWIIKKIAQRYPEMLVDFVGAQANKIAVGATMAMLDSERIQHCQFCPQRFGLAKKDGMYLCNQHDRLPEILNLHKPKNERAIPNGK